MEAFQINRYIALCRSGDTAAFKHIVSEYQHFVYTIAFRLLCNEEDAEDSTQETFIKVWQNIHRYKTKYKFSTWLYKIVCNLCYDKLRVKKNITTVEIEECAAFSDINIEKNLYHKELKKIIVTLTAELTPKQKLIFTLSALQELGVCEIKSITGMSSAKIKSNLYLAKKYIHSKIKNLQ